MLFNKQYYIHYILRIAVAMCFIGHGAFGIITKEVWCNYFAVFGIRKTLAYQLMPFVGSLDIFLGLAMLFFPVRAILAWLVLWGILTALLRPLSGEPFAELIERAGNYGAPLTLLIISGIPSNIKDWFIRIEPVAKVDKDTLTVAANCLRVTVFLLLVGHGWLNITGKAALLKQYATLGFLNPIYAAQLTGAGEIAVSFLVLIKPLRPLLLLLFIWKMGTETLYPNYGLLEWIERGGSYGAILALEIITKNRFSVNHSMQKVIAAQEQISPA